MSVVMDAFGVPATVTPPNEEAIETTVAWVPPLTEEFPVGGGLRRREAEKVLAIRRDQVSRVPKGTVIVAPEEVDGESVIWMVDGPQQIEHDCLRVVVVRQP